MSCDTSLGLQFNVWCGCVIQVFGHSYHIGRLPGKEVINVFLTSSR